MNTNKKTEWWRLDRKYCRIQTNDPGVAEQIATWNFAEVVSWGVDSYLRIFQIPSKKIKSACKSLGLTPPVKSKGRQKMVENGKAQKKNLKPYPRPSFDPNVAVELDDKFQR
jgi:hypothetical protein